MNAQTLSSIANSLERHIERLREHERNEKRQAHSLRNEAGTLKIQLAQQVSNIAKGQSNNEQQKQAVAEIERQYENRQEEKVATASDLESDAVELRRRIDEANYVLNQIKKAEGNMKVFERDVERWVDEARKVMG